ncbi:MAG: peptidylprolyl isomerase [Verrucomicrobiota bacterium]
MNARAFRIILLASACALLTGACKTKSFTSFDRFQPRRASVDDSNTVHLRVDFNKKVRTIAIQLDPGTAPQTCANFKKLVREGFYDNLGFHRVIPNFIVQTGDPLTKNQLERNNWGTGGPGYTIPLELGGKHIQGAVAMAKAPSNPESNGSQFYICIADLPDLDGQYTVFGQVTTGMKDLFEMTTLTTNSQDIPNGRVQIIEARLVSNEAPPAPPTDSEFVSQRKLEEEASKRRMTRFVERIW